jgi:hypothetical protein
LPDGHGEAATMVLAQMFLKVLISLAMQLRLTDLIFPVSRAPRDKKANGTNQLTTDLSKILEPEFGCLQFRDSHRLKYLLKRATKS